jgi:2-desacetyl-2-hydroxyethyl bacteriochlorophyllide A dehydrogenase
MQCKALVVTEPGKAFVERVELPALGENDCLIKVKAAGICGTDMHILRGEYLGAYPIVPGHEVAGVVERVGAKVHRIKAVDHVAIEPNLACDNCSECQSQRQNFCQNWQAIGVTLPGGFAEFVVAPEKAVFDIGKLPWIVGAWMEPVSCVLHGIERAGITLGDKVLVVGAGPIGILLAQTARLRGASEITQVDMNEARLTIAERSGADITLSSIDSLPKDAFDVVIDATGSVKVMSKCVDYARKGGTVLWFGVPRKDAALTLGAFSLFEKGLRLVTSYTSVRNSIQALRLLETGQLEVASLVSHQLPLAEFPGAVEMLEKGVDNVMKVMLLPEK